MSISLIVNRYFQNGNVTVNINSQISQEAPVLTGSAARSQGAFAAWLDGDICGTGRMCGLCERYFSFIGSMFLGDVGRGYRYNFFDMNKKCHCTICFLRSYF